LDGEIEAAVGVRLGEVEVASALGAVLETVGTIVVGIALETVTGAALGSEVGIILGLIFGTVDGPDEGEGDGIILEGFIVGMDVTGVTLGRTDGATVGIIDGVRLGLGLKSMIHCPQDAVGEFTRVPVFAPYVPFKPIIITREPVTAPTPPPGTHAFPPLDAIAVLASGIQLPCLP